MQHQQTILQHEDWSIKHIAQMRTTAKQRAVSATTRCMTGLVPISLSKLAFPADAWSTLMSLWSAKSSSITVSPLTPAW